MRVLALILVAAVVFCVYYFYLRMPSTDQGTASTQAINLTGVRMDLLQIAQAERAYMVLNSRCASLEELTSSRSLAMERAEREVYSYTVECSGADFTVTARHASAPAGSPVRFPVLAVDQTLQVHEVN